MTDNENVMKNTNIYIQFGFVSCIMFLNIIIHYNLLFIYYLLILSILLYKNIITDLLVIYVKPHTNIIFVTFTSNKSMI